MAIECLRLGRSATNRLFPATSAASAWAGVGLSGSGGYAGATWLAFTVLIGWDAQPVSSAAAPNIPSA